MKNLGYDKGSLSKHHEKMDCSIKLRLLTGHLEKDVSRALFHSLFKMNLSCFQNLSIRMKSLKTQDKLEDYYNQKWPRCISKIKLRSYR